MAEARGDDGEPHDRGGIIVGRDTVVALESATEAAVDQDLLAIRAGEDPDGGHARPAVAAAVTGRTPVDVQRVQTVGTVVAVAATEPQGPHKQAAMAAAESITLSGAAFSSPRFRPILRAVFEGA